MARNNAPESLIFATIHRHTGILAQQAHRAILVHPGGHRTGIWKGTQLVAQHAHSQSPGSYTLFLLALQYEESVQYAYRWLYRLALSFPIHLAVQYVSHVIQQNTPEKKPLNTPESLENAKRFI
jgi:hypothetical protein